MEEIRSKVVAVLQSAVHAWDAVVDKEKENVQRAEIAGDMHAAMGARRTLERCAAHHQVLAGLVVIAASISHPIRDEDGDLNDDWRHLWSATCLVCSATGYRLQIILGEQ